MANEARIPGGLTIRKISGSVVQMDHKPSYPGFSATVTAAKGPTPGAVTISPAGTIVPIDQLTEPGWCEIVNMDDEQNIQYGLWDRDTTTFFPLGELEPGHGVTFKFSRNFGERHDEGVGTGTTATGIVQLKLYSETADAVAYVGAFER